MEIVKKWLGDLHQIQR